MDEGKIVEEQPGNYLQVKTPGTYAMDNAVEVLQFLDTRVGIEIKNSGWKEGFGLEVSEWISIDSSNLSAELRTDGDEFEIRRISGSPDEFEILISDICSYLGLTRKS